MWWIRFHSAFNWINKIGFETSDFAQDDIRYFCVLILKMEFGSFQKLYRKYSFAKWMSRNCFSMFDRWYFSFVEKCHYIFDFHRKFLRVFSHMMEFRGNSMNKTDDAIGKIFQYFFGCYCFCFSGLVKLAFELSMTLMAVGNVRSHLCHNEWPFEIRKCFYGDEPVSFELDQCRS